MKKQQPLKRRQGFTVIELLVVIALVAMLSIAGRAAYTNTRRSSRDARRKTDLEQIRTGLELYRSDNGTYPQGTPLPSGTTESTLKTPLTSPTAYMNPATFPKDPNTPQGWYYYYQRNPSGAGNNTYVICAYLENYNASTDPLCPNYGVPCGPGGAYPCNYGLVQP